MVRVLSFAATCLALSAVTAHADIRWETHYDVALAKARAQNKPLCIDVYTDWCGWCQKMEHEVYVDPRIQQMANNFVMLKLNGDRWGKPFAESMKIQGYPTLIFATSHSEQLSRRGYVGLADFYGAMYNAWSRNNSLYGHQRTPAATKPLLNAGKTRAPRRMSIKHGAVSWKKQPELRGAVKRTNYRGAFVLGDSGVVAVDSAARKSAKHNAR